MKKNILLLAMLAGTTVLSFTACSSDPAEKDEAVVVLPEQPYKEEAIKLEFNEESTFDYTVKNEEGQEEKFQVRELELTEAGYYYIMLEKKQDEVKATRASKSNFTYKFGTYTIDANGNYVLSGFGIISIETTQEQPGETTVNVSVTIQDSESATTTTVEVTATVAAPPAEPSDEKTTNSTNNLCRAWDIVSTRVQIEGVSAFYQEKNCDLNSIYEYIKSYASLSDKLEQNLKITKIEFSDKGSFALHYANGKIDRATWKWDNVEEGRLSYTWDFADMGYSFVDGTALVVINPVGKDSQLQLFGTTDNGQGVKKKVTITVGIR